MKRKKPHPLIPRSLKLLRDRGYIAEKVEQRLPIPGKFVTRDFCNFADLIAFGDNPPRIIAVQVTSSAHLAEREKKIREEPRAWKWLGAKGEILMHGWAKRGPRGKRKTFQVTERWIEKEE